MLTTTLRMTVHAQKETVWEFLLDRQENPQSYLPEIEDLHVVERFDGGLVRETRVAGVTMRERVVIGRTAREITVELLHHPLYTGTIVARLIPTSVQNPMAPLELEYALRLERKSLHLEGMMRGEQELLAALRHEMTTIRDRAEKREKR